MNGQVMSAKSSSVEIMCLPLADDFLRGLHDRLMRHSGPRSTAAFAILQVSFEPTQKSMLHIHTQVAPTQSCK